MHSIKLKSHIGSDGFLKVRLPDVQNMDIEVIIVYHTNLPKPMEATPLSQFYGCIQDDSFIRYPQNEQPEREPHRMKYLC
ncbi:MULTISPECIES: hypothetical protein [Planktothrix]|jgi:hypothetical protein|uniref:Uncharacterized protein n=1 Tax=Planktothrix rubescens CCAP 1459/22 TaxID=329571 RepID=A0A6J7ZLA6_PLARU|nr:MULTISPECIES: hypothetical protein [Planktothrix]CAD5946445.1 hypothetical protein NO108_02639 [Planktothrix rubescens]CAC5344627.1 conserved hypothetical protein [Planktothrix rubescens NIVA-CYA 18]CAD0217878.1 conserved hypothetical protein [Planktothrix agardhii]CAD5920060.1 hypothetical protein PCC7821_00600 [Planktothrix rubescens NIVA-CYA 18]CAD5927968.1 hypothetical protein NO758_01092 [Planktothrix agardhii]